MARGGIGRAYALGMAEEGASIVVADLGDATETVAEIRSDGGDAESITVDVSSETATDAMAAFAVERYGRIDVLINNAAMFATIEMGPFDEINVDTWDKVFEVNVRGSWLAAKAVSVQMKQQKYGRSSMCPR